MDEAQRLRQLTLDQLAAEMGGVQENAPRWSGYLAEFKRRSARQQQHASLVAMGSLVVSALAIVIGAGATVVDVSSAERPEPIAQPAPLAPDPRLCTPLEPEPPVAGSIMPPRTAKEAAAMRDFLTAEAEARDWGRRGWDRAGIAADDLCPPPATPPRPG